MKDQKRPPVPLKRGIVLAPQPLLLPQWGEYHRCLDEVLTIQGRRDRHRFSIFFHCPASDPESLQLWFCDPVIAERLAGIFRLDQFADYGVDRGGGTFTAIAGTDMTREEKFQLVETAWRTHIFLCGHL